ncbi:MAG: hypothetical protein NC548_48870 [Lachnospiraceae bacterium]|nr:hypothetical protein [Lachnospiraceae bacterium]
MDGKRKNERVWHSAFRAYTESIVNHPNYTGLFYERVEKQTKAGNPTKGDVKWVVAGKSPKGKKRKAWWDNKCRSLGMKIAPGCYGVVSRKIHPTGKHTCQCCGKSLSIFYEYPNKQLHEKIKNILGIDYNRTDYTIGEIVDRFFDTQEKRDNLAKELKLPTSLSIDNLHKEIYKKFVDTQSKMFSPGVMSNCPDRFDGFHSDGLCCREHTDKGRNKENMKTYTQDRRAYEEWSDGNYNLANRLMGEYQKASPMVCPKCGKIAKMSADHIGPISLGFCHTTHFAPMCKSCNSSKNNRFTYEDVKTLLSLEKRGESVISWHANPIWDLVKTKIKNDDDAKRASLVMLVCHQNILNLFAVIYNKTGEQFLSQYLHPEYSLFDYRFENFSIEHPEKMTIKQTKCDSKNKTKNQQRYIRIAFESLKDFHAKNNRRKKCYLQTIDKDIADILTKITAKDYVAAESILKSAIAKLSKSIMEKEWID